MNERLFNKFKPVVMLHPQEIYYPCTIEYYLANSSVWKDDEQIAPMGSATTDTLANYDETTSLKPIALAYRGSTKENLNFIPFYVALSKLSSDCWELKYIFLYVYNGEIGCWSCSTHLADMEHITIRINPHTEEIISVYFSAHGNDQGYWASPDELEFYSPNGIIVFSALDSHASYRKAKCYPRIFFCANDHTSNKGQLWDPQELVEITEDTRWNQYKGHLGYPDHVKVPQYHSWWKKESGRSISWLGRIFACWKW